MRKTPRLLLCSIASLVAFVSWGVDARGQIAPVITDHQVIAIEQEPEPQQVGPVSLLGLPIPNDFPVPIILDVAHRATINVQAPQTAGQQIVATGEGGTISASGNVYVQAGQTYTVTEDYRLTATVDSRFIEGEFKIEDGVTWEFTPARSGRFSFSVVGAARDFALEITGDVAGNTDIDVVGNEIAVDVATTRVIPANDFVTYAGAFTGAFDRTASVGFVEAVLPPWDPTGDGVVNIADLVTVAREFGRSGPELGGDINNDGVVNIVDLVIVARHFLERFELVAGAPKIAARAGNANAVLRFRRLDGDLVRIDVIPQTDTPIAGYALELAYDPAAWEWMASEDSGRIASPLRLPMESKTGVARLTVVSVPVEANAVTAGPLAAFLFRAKTGSDLDGIALRRIQLSDPDARLIPVGSVTRSRFSEPSAARRTSVGPNFPNPFNPETWIPFDLAQAGRVQVSIYAQDGSLVRALDLGRLPQGSYRLPSRAARWDGRNERGERVASGVYFYRFTTPGVSQTGRMIVAK